MTRSSPACARWSTASSCADVDFTVAQRRRIFSVDVSINLSG